MMTTAGELLECLKRLLLGEFIVPETPVYLLSRDGEQCRKITNIRLVSRSGKCTVYLERGAEEEETLSVSDLRLFCQAITSETEVRLVADGHSLANSEPLSAVKLAAEIRRLNHVDFADADVVLCT